MDIKILLVLIAVGIYAYFRVGKRGPKKGKYFGTTIQESWRQFLMNKVSFYQDLSAVDRTTFIQKVIDFLNVTRVIGYNGAELTDEDKLLVGASAVIPVFNLEHWEYKYINEVILYPSIIPMGDSGMFANGFVGSGPMEGRMVLAKDALHHGYSNDTDRKNTGLHEFLHIIDKQDGEIDGVPEALISKDQIPHWLALVKEVSEDIEQEDIKIDKYALTNRAEFFTVVAVYYFEFPEMLERKHKKLYDFLHQMFSKKSL